MGSLKAALAAGRPGGLARAEPVSQTRLEVLARRVRCTLSAGRKEESDVDGVGIIGAIVIGIVAGWIAEKVMRRNHGILTNLIVGVVGAFIGAFLAGMLGFDDYGFVGTLIVATLGAILLLAIVGMVRGRGRRV